MGVYKFKGENKWLNVIIRIANVKTVSAGITAAAEKNAVSPDTSANNNQINQAGLQ